MDTLLFFYFQALFLLLLCPVPHHKNSWLAKLLDTQNKIGGSLIIGSLQIKFLIYKFLFKKKKTLVDVFKLLTDVIFLLLFFFVILLKIYGYYGKFVHHFGLILIKHKRNTRINVIYCKEAKEYVHKRVIGIKIALHD